MNILVTGAAGFIGSHLAEALCQAGHRVLGVDGFTGFYDRRQKESNAAAVRSAGAEILRLDLAEAALGEALAGIDAVYHLAAQPGLSASTTFDDYLRNNVIATHRLLAAAEASGSVKRFIHVSTSSVYGREATGDEATLPEPTSAYGVTKLAAEQLVLARHREGILPATSLRIFSVYGPRERPDKLFPRVIQAILRDEAMPIHEGSGAHRRAFTFVGDIVRGAIAALDRWENVAGEIVNLGSDVETPVGEALDLLQSLLGKRAHFVTKPKRPGDQARTCAHIEKARRLLGYAPKTPLAEGLRIQVAAAQAA